jgi:putative ABC transport system permease protein
MRSLRFAVRLARRNVRRRPAQAALLLLTLTLATGTIGVGMAVYSSADRPWDRVWTATDGFHVGAAYYRLSDAARGDADLDAVRADFAELAAAPGVRAVGGPWTHLYGQLDVAGGGTEELTAEIRDPGRSPVDQPMVTAGSWLAADDGGVVLEDGLADTLQVGPGDTISVQGHELRVRGAAMTVSTGRFPLSQPAQIWVTPATSEARLAAGRRPRHHPAGDRRRRPRRLCRHRQPPRRAARPPPSRHRPHLRMTPAPGPDGLRRRRAPAEVPTTITSGYADWSALISRS